MQSCFIGFLLSVGLPRRMSRTYYFLAAFALAALLTARAASAQTVPDEAYGPYNAISIPAGPAVIKPLAPPPPLDPRYHGPEGPDPLTAGAAPWTLTFWFRSSEPLTGTMLLAGSGDPEAADARFIGVENNHLGLWLGQAEHSADLLTPTVALDAAEWHFAAAACDGQHVTLYAEGTALAS